VHITNIHVPKNIIELEAKVQDIKTEKNRVVRSQNTKKQPSCAIRKSS
jgi:ATP-dependent Clp protease ATP-binding subunit ClpC